MMSFVLGGLLGALLVYAFYWRAQHAAARLEEEKQVLMEERQIVLDYMHTMVDAVGERLPREELFQRIVHAAILSTGALSACIFEKDADDMMRGAAVEGLFPPHRPIADTHKMKLGSRAKFIEQVLKSESFPVGEGVVGRVAATGRGELVAQAAADPRIVKHEDEALVVRSVIAAPITVRKRLIGVLCVCNASDGLPFTETDYSLVEALAEQAGLAVHNADFLALQVDKQRLDLDLALASDVQQMLLPRTMPVVPGLDIDARYLAAQKVSGDLYDVFKLGFDRVGVAVADVSGKGVSASLLMAICRTTLRQIAPMHTSPARVLAELNRSLAGDMREGMYITMAYAVVDAGKNQVTVARAGHELTLLSRRDPHTGSYLSEYVGSEGMPVGLVDPELFDSVIEDRTLGFAPGSTLVLYTDGLTEAPNEQEQEFGGARLADALRAGHTGSAREVNDAILAAVQRFSGTVGLRDDYTLLTVKRT
ncbi:GAF domain-containing SpoIIE family protein phosphatase [Opitutus sp. GAS368]|jgi:sigma-B regulation protein RsbU (phosphoserine phosphatase)|uniref:PP2C family protein-serine/threonine phosphatase n=1 Tax=Opitutus sp. GAS368 TaxID=1882749 RepID=UPI00087B59C8|nr:GAF domain-containing SpoIIE family protein phosphatase [Opitutus sp. GAS368]SDR65429.1 sigma-B regulation protein RsbU (phosphoserine phosphatase) [Opitutus sp. GAS368]